MRICRKCSKQGRNESRICRDCGGILEEVPDDPVPAAIPQSESCLCGDSPFAAEPASDATGSADGGFAVEEVFRENEPSPPARTTAKAWACPQCGETVPGTFDMCWKCLTTREGGQADERDLRVLQQISSANEDVEEAEPQHEYMEAAWDEHYDDQSLPITQCPRCQSDKIMRGITVQDQGQGSKGALQVVVLGNPKALIFKDRLYGELRADICGDCGHVELRVLNPKELYQHYRDSME